MLMLQIRSELRFVGLRELAAMMKHKLEDGVDEDGVRVDVVWASFQGTGQIGRKLWL